MGLFSSSKKTYVDSVVYNMAGDEDERVNYLQATTLNTIMSGNSKTYIGESINKSYLNGPGMSLRSFYRWAVEHYDYIGLPSGSINGTGNINEAVIRANIPGTAGKEVLLQAIDIHRADYMDWAIQYMYANYESLIDTNWIANIVGSTITIHFEDTTTASFTATGFDASARYLYVLYSVAIPDSTSATTTGSSTSIDDPADWPSTSGWRTISDVETPVTGGYERHAVFQNQEAQPHIFVGSVEMQVIRHNAMYWDQVVTDLGGGVYETAYTWRIDYFDVTSPVNDDKSVFLYKMNTGVNPALDALDDIVSTLDGQFFPIIPMRVNNQWLSDVNDTAYELAKKAYKKAFNGQTYDECIDKLADNEKLSDIDFANVVFGVSLNVKEQKCKKYLYHFFLNLLNNQTYGKAEYDAYGPQLDDYRDYVHDLQVWSQFDGMGGAAPTPVPHPVMRLNSITISNNGNVNTEYSVTVLWNYIQELSGTGVYSGLKKGQVTLVNQGTVEYNDPFYDDPSPVTTFDIIWQKTNSSWVGVRVVGALHRNYVYNGKYTETYAGEALDDADESGFIVPLHYNTFRDMGIVDGTQMSTACTFMVLNCYKIVKIKWYQKGIFKILLVVLFAIAAAFFTGGAGFGLLGANLALGTSLGFTGLTAGIVGSVVNALAAVALSTIIQTVSTKLFGDLGGLIGAIISFVTFSVVTAFNSLGSFDWASLFKPANLLKLTNALTDGYSSMVQANAQDMYAQSQDLQDSFKSQSDAISELYSKNIGFANQNINPLNFVDNTKYMYPETRDTFLTRTLLTGSDIASLSQTLLTDFSDLTLKLPGIYT